MMGSQYTQAALSSQLSCISEVADLGPLVLLGEVGRATAWKGAI